jgi:flagellar hook assembly protein FlgD
LEIFDILGRQVRLYAFSNVPAGTHTIEWDGSNQVGSPASSGVYFYRLVTGQLSITHRMLLLR